MGIRIKILIECECFTWRQRAGIYSFLIPTIAIIGIAVGTVVSPETGVLCSVTAVIVDPDTQCDILCPDGVQGAGMADITVDCIYLLGGIGATVEGGPCCLVIVQPFVGSIRLFSPADEGISCASGDVHCSQVELCFMVVAGGQGNSGRHIIYGAAVRVGIKDQIKGEARHMAGIYRFLSLLESHGDIKVQTCAEILNEVTVFATAAGLCVRIEALESVGVTAAGHGIVRDRDLNTLACGRSQGDGLRYSGGVTAVACIEGKHIIVLPDGIERHNRIVPFHFNLHDIEAVGFSIIDEVWSSCISIVCPAKELSIRSAGIGCHAHI